MWSSTGWLFLTANYSLPLLVCFSMPICLPICLFASLIYFSSISLPPFVLRSFFFRLIFPFLLRNPYWTNVVFFFFNHWSFLRMCRFRPMSKMLWCIRLQEKFLGHSYIKIYIEGSFFWKLKNNMYMLMVVFPHTMDISSENV